MARALRDSWYWKGSILLKGVNLAGIFVYTGANLAGSEIGSDIPL